MYNKTWVCAEGREGGCDGENTGSLQSSYIREHLWTSPSRTALCWCQQRNRLSRKQCLTSHILNLLVQSVWWFHRGCRGCRCLGPCSSWTPCYTLQGQDLKQKTNKKNQCYLCTRSILLKDAKSWTVEASCHVRMTCSKSVATQSISAESYGLHEFPEV